MDSAPIAESEPQRLAALRSTALLDTPAEPAFDELVALTARLLGRPDRRLQPASTPTVSGRRPAPAWPTATRRRAADSFCAHAIAGDEPVRRPRHGRRSALRRATRWASASTPARRSRPAGQRIGTLCVAGDAPAHAQRRRPRDPARAGRRRSARTSSSSRRERERAEEAGVPAPARGGDEPAGAASRTPTSSSTTCASPRSDLAGADGAILWTATPGGMLRATAAVGSRRRRRRAAARARRGLAPGVRQRRADLPRRATQLLGVAGWGAALFEPLLLHGRPVGVLTVVLGRRAGA